VFDGPLVNVIVVLVSIGTAYLVMSFASIMDYVQALFSSSSPRFLARWFWGCCGSARRRQADSGACLLERLRRSECWHG